jgi:hypothetical protein
MWRKILVIGLATMFIGSSALAANINIKINFDGDGCPASTRLKDNNGSNVARCTNNGKKQADAACAHVTNTIEWKGSKAFEIQGLPASFVLVSSGNNKKVTTTVPANQTPGSLKYSIFGMADNCELDPRIIIN